MFDKVEFIKPFYNPAFIGPLWFSFNGGGDEHSLEIFDPDFTWVTANNGWNFIGSPYVGMQSTWDHVFVNGGADLDPESYLVDVAEIFDSGPETVTVLGHYTGNSVRSGKHHRIQVAHIWTFKNERIREFRQYNRHLPHAALR